MKVRNFTQRSEIKTGFISNLFSKEEKEVSNFDFIKMNPPTIFVMSQNYSKKNIKRHGHLAFSSTSSNTSKQKKQNFDEKTSINHENELIESFLFEKWLNLNE